jgi:hypothetical protein
MWRSKGVNKLRHQRNKETTAEGCRGIPAIVPSNQLTLESSLPTQAIERLFKIAQCLGSEPLLVFELLDSRLGQQAKFGKQFRVWIGLEIKTCLALHALDERRRDGPGERRVAN